MGDLCRHRRGAHDRDPGRMRHGGPELRPTPNARSPGLEHPAARGDHGLDRSAEPRGLVDDPQRPGTLPADRSRGSGKPRPEKGRGAHPRGARPPGPEQGRSLPDARRLGLRHPEPRQRRHGACRDHRPLFRGPGRLLGDRSLRRGPAFGGGRRRGPPGRRRGPARHPRLASGRGRPQLRRSAHRPGPSQP